MFGSRPLFCRLFLLGRIRFNTAKNSEAANGKLIEFYQGYMIPSYRNGAIMGAQAWVEILSTDSAHLQFRADGLALGMESMGGMGNVIAAV